MKKWALVYLGLVFAVAGVMTGVPRSIWNWFQADEVVAAAPMAADVPAEVTMAEPRPAVLAVPMPAAEPVAVADAEPAAATAALIAATDTAAVDAGRLAKPVVRGGDAGLDRTTSAILAELAIIPKQDMTAEDTAMLNMSQGALAGLAAIRGETAAPVKTLESIVVAALREGKPDAYIDALVNEAAGTGAITVPSALVTSDGRVDTAVLLTTLVTKAQVASGAQAAVNPEDVVAGGEGVEVRMTNSALEGMTANQFYTVAAGDSLGAIAQKFYGDAAYFPVIFDANRTLLSSPDQLNVGLRLVVPAASTI